MHGDTDKRTLLVFLARIPRRASNVGGRGSPFALGAADRYDVVVVAVVVDDETVAALARLLVLVLAVAVLLRRAFKVLVRVVLVLRGAQVVQLARLLLADDSRRHVAVVVARRDPLVADARRPHARWRLPAAALLLLVVLFQGSRSFAFTFAFFLVAIVLEI